MRHNFNRFILWMIIGVIGFDGAVLAQSLYPRINSTELVVSPKETIKAYDFKLSEVSLGDGLFKDAMERNRQWLLDLDPDRLLHRFYLYAGLPTKGAVYGGWESEGISGHTLGHYLSACALQYGVTHEKEFKDRVDYIVTQLDLCQQQYTGVMSGFVGGIPEQSRIFTEISEGKLYSSGFDLNGGWVPMYTMHKLYAGLIDAFLYVENQDAKKVVTLLADWLINVTNGLNEDQFQQFLQCEFGGMNDAMYSLYALTGEEKYLTLAERFYHKAVLDPLLEHQDQVNGMHANTLIPKVIGCSTAAWIMGDEKMLSISKYFWNTIVNHHSYANGGNSDFERFTPADQISKHFSSNSTETCNTYNMLKLTKKLFSFSADADLMDYYERALYNHILASQHPKTGMVTYYMNHVNGGHKSFSSPFDSFWCCVGTGIENHTKYTESIYSHGFQDSLFVNLFISSEMNWTDRGIKLRQVTKFPFEEKTVLEILEGKQKFTMLIRQPKWLSNDMIVSVNGKKQHFKEAKHGFLLMKRTWKKGDRIEITLPMSFTTMAAPDRSSCKTFFYGPILMAAELDDNRDPLDSDPVVISDDEDYAEKIFPVDKKKLLFISKGLTASHELHLKPLFSISDKDYALYLNFYSKQEWSVEKESYFEYVKKEKELRQRLVDEIRFEMQSERDHNLTGEKTNAGSLNTYSWRDASDGGYFEFDLSTAGETNLQLLVKYWGRDGGDRIFDIMIDGKVLSRQVLEDKGVDKVYEITYQLPVDYLRDKAKVKIRFQAVKGYKAGGVFGCRLIREKSK
ncbi:beta-L-arabinofuranosidase domain-containing protein [Geofilum sp. OHC36d9]|uniref:beta-L-arabinofuranosidase domain-containing protein n=1 Tax=Geofilum sp. OHC36d9 TaxID=3458413 RepID=UPI0040343469